MDKIKIGISSCLLGQKVRYDGGHQLDSFIVQTLGQFLEFVPVCPEVEAGFSTPREAFRLVGDVDDPRLITSRTKIDYTETMLSWADKKVIQLENEDLRGFIFKAKSPSSGMERVKVYSESGMPEKKGVGLFARAFMRHFPLLPVEEDGRLHEPILRENFIERIFVYDRWRKVFKEKSDRNKLIDFHTRHKLLIRAHSEKHYKILGKIVGHVKDFPLTTAIHDYQTNLMEALALKTTLNKHVNVLQHMLGYFKNVLSSDEKQEIIEIIEQFKSGLIPLIVPITLFNHLVRKYQEPYLKIQYYLNPHPLELKLRNHV